MKSILQNVKECWVCGATQQLQNHHIYFGPNRKVSDKNGFVVWLCGNHHNMSNYAVHFNRDVDLMLKRICQEKFEETNTREDFIKLIGKNYR